MGKKSTCKLFFAPLHWDVGKYKSNGALIVNPRRHNIDTKTELFQNTVALKHLYLFH